MVDYGVLEPYLADLTDLLAREAALDGLPMRWLAVKLMENDQAARETLRARVANHTDILASVDMLRENFAGEQGVDAERRGCGPDRPPRAFAPKERAQPFGQGGQVCLPQVFWPAHSADHPARTV